MSEERPEIFLPGQYRDPSGLTRVIGGVPALETIPESEQEILRGIVGGPTAVVAMTSPPSFHDQLHVYATHQELYEYMFDEHLGAVLDPSSVGVEDVIERVSGLPFEPAMRFLASVQKALYFGRIDLDRQRWLMHAVYLNSPISAAGERWLREHENGAIFTEQQLFALQRLVVLHASDQPADDLTPEQNAALRMALLYVPGTVLDVDSNELSDSPESVADERWLRYFVGNGGFIANGSLKHELARSHLMYEVIAKSRLVRRGHRDFCPLDRWLLDTYGMTFLELQSFGLAVLAGSRLNQQDGPTVVVKPEYFDSTGFAGRAESGFAAFAADREWFKQEFLASKETPRRAAFECHPFMRRPGLRQADGGVLIVAPRAVETWLGSAGTFYRLFDIAREKGSAERDRFTRFNGFLLEHYVRRLAHVAYPYPERRGSIGVGKIYGERPYKKGKQTLMTSDVAIDLGTDLVLVEITSSRLTDKSRVEADAESVKADLEKMIEKKMRQLGRVVGDIFDDPSRFPEIDLRFVKNVWPIVVAGEGLFQNPTVWAYTDQRAGDALRFPHDRVWANVRPVVILDPEEFEILGAMVADGISLTEILRRKTSSMWIELDLKKFLLDEFAHRWDMRAKFVSEEQRRAFNAMLRNLRLKPARSRSSDAGARLNEHRSPSSTPRRRTRVNPGTSRPTRPPRRAAEPDSAETQRAD